MSTIGASPVTVTVSCERADAISAFTVAVNSAGGSMPFALQRGEALQRERHRVRPRPQIDDAIEALASVTADFEPFDERGAAGLDRHARQHAAGRVAHDTGNAALAEYG